MSQIMKQTCPYQDHEICSAQRPFSMSCLQVSFDEGQRLSSNSHPLPRFFHLSFYLLSLNSRHLITYISIKTGVSTYNHIIWFSYHSHQVSYSFEIYQVNLQFINHCYHLWEGHACCRIWGSNRLCSLPSRTIVSVSKSFDAKHSWQRSMNST